MLAKVSINEDGELIGPIGHVVAPDNTDSGGDKTTKGVPL